MPFGSHGVYVPPRRLNPHIAPFEVSLVRAAELFIDDVMKEVETSFEKAGDQWNKLYPSSETELQWMDAFKAAQYRFCEAHNITNSTDWLFLAKQLLSDKTFFRDA